MKTIKSYNFDSVLEKELKNKNFKEAYESFNEEFALAKEIIKLRKTNHLTQKELALKVGTSQPAIARLESGNYNNVSLSFLRKVALALGTTPEIKLERLNLKNFVYNFRRPCLNFNKPIVTRPHRITTLTRCARKKTRLAWRHICELVVA